MSRTALRPSRPPTGYYETYVLTIKGRNEVTNIHRSRVRQYTAGLKETNWILQLLSEHPEGLNTFDLSFMIGEPSHIIANHIRKLRQDGYVEESK